MSPFGIIALILLGFIAYSLSPEFRRLVNSGWSRLKTGPNMQGGDKSTMLLWAILVFLFILIILSLLR